MPMLSVMTNRPTNARGLVIVTNTGESFRLPTSPSKWNYKDMQRWGQIDREGHKPISRVRGGGLRALDFSILVAALDWHISVERQVEQLTVLGARGITFRIKGGSRAYQGACWWYVKDYGIAADRLTPDGEATQVNVDFQLEEYVNPSLSIIAPPPPVRPAQRPSGAAGTPKPSPVRAPVYRYHTTVRGDWLSKLAIRYLGSMGRWPEIYRLNRTIIGSNPNCLRAGLKLRIPPR